MEHGRVGNIRVTPVDLSRSDNANRRGLLFHGTNLNRRGMGPQDNIVGDIKGVLHVPGRVVFRHVESLEVVIIRFNFRAFHDVESETCKNIADLPA